MILFVSLNMLARSEKDESCITISFFIDDQQNIVKTNQ